MRSHDQSAGACIAEVDPHELSHDTGDRIQPAESVVESARRDGRQLCIRNRGVHLHPAHQTIHVDGSGRGHSHARTTLIIDQTRTEHVVVIDDRSQRFDNTGPVDSQRQFQRQQLVETLVAAGPFEHEALDRSERHPTDAAAFDLGENSDRVGVGAEDGNLCQLCHRLVLEHVLGREENTAGLGPGYQLDRHDRVSALSEERVVGTDLVEAENVGKDLAQDAFHLGGGSAELLYLEYRLRQSLSVQLAGRGQRHVGQNHDRRRHHVRRQGA